MPRPMGIIIYPLAPAIDRFTPWNDLSCLFKFEEPDDDGREAIK